MQVPSFSVTLFCVALVTLISDETYGNMVIVRGENDRFTNMSGCVNSKAACSGNNCAQCQCAKEQTFIQTRGQYGECVSNDLMVYATSHEATFLLQHNSFKHCLYQKKRRFIFLLSIFLKFVVRTYDNCNFHKTNNNYRWLWTKFGQLLHWETLECMTDEGYYHDYNRIILKECDRNNQKQKWKCTGRNKKYIQLLGRNLYMDYGHDDYVAVRHERTETAQWTRYNTHKDVCSKAVGCEMFADGSSLIILNKTKCEEHSECSGEKKIDLTKTGCSILPNKTQYLHNDTWRALEIKNGSFEMTTDHHRPSLKWNLSETPKNWRGLLVKIQFKCYDWNGKTEHCVVIKYAGTFEGFNDLDDNNNKDSESHKSGNNNTKKTIIIVVCVLVALVITGVTIFLIYRYRNRFVRSRKTNTESRDAKPKEDVYANTSNPLYQTNNNQSGQTECSLYEPAPENVYQYVDADHKTADAPPKDFTHAYAVLDGPINKTAESTPENNKEL